MIYDEDEIEVEEVFYPRVNRKYAAKRKFLLKDKRSLYFSKKTPNETILKNDVFYGKKVTMGTRIHGVAYAGSVFVGIPRRKWEGYMDYYLFQEWKLNNFHKQDKFCQKEAFDEAPVGMRYCQSENEWDYYEDDYNSYEDDCYHWESDMPSVSMHREPRLYWEEKHLPFHEDYIYELHEMNRCQDYNYGDDYWDGY